MRGYGVFLLFFKRFDLFITWAVAANGGLLEEVVVVWSGGSDTGVSFITVGHSLRALMEIIMHVHNYPKAAGLDLICMPSSLKFFDVITFRCKVCWIWQLLYLYSHIYYILSVRLILAIESQKSEFGHCVLCVPNDFKLQFVSVQIFISCCTYNSHHQFHNFTDDEHHILRKTLDDWPGFLFCLCKGHFPLSHCRLLASSVGTFFNSNSEILMNSEVMRSQPLHQPPCLPRRSLPQTDSET